MTEFTSEFIAEQRNIIKQGTMTVQEMKANNEIDLHINMMYRRAKTEHCEKYYPDALDEIERLITERQFWIDKAEEKQKQAIEQHDKIEKLQARIEKLEKLLETDIDAQELSRIFHLVLRETEVFDNIYTFITSLDNQEYYDVVKLLLDVRKLILGEVLKDSE